MVEEYDDASCSSGKFFVSSPRRPIPTSYQIHVDAPRPDSLMSLYQMARQWHLPSWVMSLNPLFDTFHPVNEVHLHLSLLQHGFSSLNLRKIEYLKRKIYPKWMTHNVLMQEIGSIMFQSRDFWARIWRKLSILKGTKHVKWTTYNVAMQGFGSARFGSQNFQG